MQVLLLSRTRVRALANEEVVQLAVTVGVVKDALCLFLVSARSAALLHVALKALWSGVVDHKAHIALINAHAKSNGRNDHLNLVVHPVALNLLAARIGQVCVIEVTLDLVVALQVLCKALTVLPRNAVDDAALVFESGVQQKLDVLLYVFDLLLVLDFID